MRALANMAPVISRCPWEIAAGVSASFPAKNCGVSPQCNAPHRRFRTLSRMRLRPRGFEEGRVLAHLCRAARRAGGCGRLSPQGLKLSLGEWLIGAQCGQHVEPFDEPPAFLPAGRADRPCPPSGP